MHSAFVCMYLFQSIEFNKALLNILNVPTLKYLESVKYWEKKFIPGCWMKVILKAHQGTLYSVAMVVR